MLGKHWGKTNCISTPRIAFKVYIWLGVLRGKLFCNLSRPWVLLSWHHARAQSPASVVVVGSTQAWSMRNFLGKNHAAAAASSSSCHSNSSNASPSFQRATLAKAENQPRLLAYVKREGLRPLTSSSCTAWHIGLLYRKPLSRTPPARSCLGDGRLGGRRQQASLLSTRVWDTDHGHRIPADTAHNFAPSQRLPLPRLVLIRSHCVLLSRKSKTNCLKPATDFFSTSILL